MKDDSDRLVMREVVVDGLPMREPDTRREVDLLRTILQTTRRLLGLAANPVVYVHQWQECAMELHCLMVTAEPVRESGRRFFKRHPTTHFALVHSMDSLKEQNWEGNATEGRLLCLEAGEHMHQLHMNWVQEHCRRTPRYRCHDLLFMGKLVRGLSVTQGFVPVCFHAKKKAEFHGQLFSN